MCFEGGETVEGFVELKIKKKTVGENLKVALVGTKEEEYEEDDKREVRYREIYRKEYKLEEDYVYQSDSQKQYGFKIELPEGEKKSYDQGWLLDGVIDVLRTEQSDINWDIEARLNAKGVDLTGTRRIFISGIYSV